MSAPVPGTAPDLPRLPLSARAGGREGNSAPCLGARILQAPPPGLVGREEDSVPRSYTRTPLCAAHAGTDHRSPELCLRVLQEGYAVSGGHFDGQSDRDATADRHNSSRLMPKRKAAPETPAPRTCPWRCGRIAARHAVTLRRGSSALATTVAAALLDERSIGLSELRDTRYWMRGAITLSQKKRGRARVFEVALQREPVPTRDGPEARRRALAHGYVHAPREPGRITRSSAPGLRVPQEQRTVQASRPAVVFAISVDE